MVKRNNASLIKGVINVRAEIKGSKYNALNE